MSQRAQRVAELIKQEISQLLQRGIKDPRIGFVTVTDVEVTRDLRYAKVYFSVLGDDKTKAETLEGLNAANGFIRREIGKYLRLRHIPELIFKFDSSVEYGAYINKILHDIKKDQEFKTDYEEDEGVFDTEDEYEEDEYEEDEYEEDNSEDITTNEEEER